MAGNMRHLIPDIRHRRLLGAALALALLAGCGEPPPASPAGTLPAVAGDETERLNTWFDERFEEQLDFSPMMKTRIGRKDDYDQLDDYSEAAADRELAWRRQSVAAMQSQFDYAALTPTARLSWDLWVYTTEQAERAHEFRRRGYPFHQMSGLHTSLPQFLITNHRVDTLADMQAWIARAAAAGRAIRQMLTRAELAAGEGVHAPRFAYEAVIAQAEAVISGAPFTERAEDGSAAAPSALWEDATTKIAALRTAELATLEETESLLAAAAAALQDELAPAYRALIDWAQAELPLAGEIATGVHQLPDGEAYYTERLAAMTTTAMTAAEIHTLGLAEVERIHAAMLSVMSAVGYAGSLQEFFVFMREDPMFFYPDTDAGRDAYLDTARRHLDFIADRLADYFGLLPQASLEVRRVEAFREVPGQAQHYQRGTPDGSRPGIYYSHLSDMRAMPIPMMEVIAYHEGNPGHHMQLSIAQELEGLPRFRTLAGFTAFSEGWGLYAEALAKEMGAYEDPYSEFGRLTSELWRAIRLVVDTGLHDLGWTEQQAVDYMTLNSPISAGQIQAEIRRYIVMPGQATAYKIGMLRIQELRRRAEIALGERFDIRAFHDAVLGSGGLPLELLERMIDEWISERVTP